MSDDESSNSSSDESEDLNITGLVATRAKRGTAGNLYATLLANIDDEELQKELVEEDEEDAESYDGEDAHEDDDDALESSSDEEDAGPPAEGQAEDLTGEKELLKAERAEKSRKRKAQTAKLTVPAWHKSVKKVKLADEVTADDGSSSPIEPAKKKKKSERSDWRPAAEDLPTRQSSRKSAVINREIVHANLQEHAERSRKQKATLSETVKKERSNRREDLTLEERLEKCKRIEKETGKELGRFEREEAERVRLREEALMAKRRRAIDGPLIRTLTTSGMYENGKLKIRRLSHGSQLFENSNMPKAQDDTEIEPSSAIGSQAQTQTPTPLPVSLPQIAEIKMQDATTISGLPPEGLQIKQEAVDGSTPDTKDVLMGNTQVAPQSSLPYFPSAPILSELFQRPAPPPPAPIIREQAQRHLLMLENFTDLENVPTKTAKAKNAFEPTAIAQVLMPDSYPTLTDDQAAYLRKHRKLKQDVAVKPTCALTMWAGKYKDAKTGVVFADVAAYKMLQRMIAGGCTWNSMLQCWTGNAYGSMGRAARGVPPGFDGPIEAPVSENTIKTGADS